MISVITLGTKIFKDFFDFEMELFFKNTYQENSKSKQLISQLYIN